MNIKDFSNTEIHKADKEIKKEKTLSDNFEDIKENADFKKVEEDYGGLIQDFLLKYGQMEEKDLLNEMLKLIKQKKADGTFDAEKIKQIATQVAPFLDEQQRAKMLNLLNYLD